MSAFRRGRAGWTAFRDKLIYKDQAEYLDGDVPPGTRLALIRHVDRVNDALGYTKRFLARMDRRIDSVKKVSAPIRILDVGFGGGGMLEAIFRRLRVRGIAAELTGVEISRDLVAGVRERFERNGVRATLLELDGRDLPFDNGHFDVVYSNYTVHHLREAEDVAAFFLELSRVGRSGLVFDLDRRLITPLYCGLIALFAVPPAVIGDGIKSARRSYSADEIDLILEACGAVGTQSGGVHALRAEEPPFLRCTARKFWPYWLVEWGNGC